MRQFLLPRRYGGEPRLTLAGPDFHHLIRVLRKKEGDSVPAVTALGARYTMSIESVAKSSCRVVLRPVEGEAWAPLPGRPPARINLLQCLPKGKKMDLIVRQAVEAGISWIVPVESERSVPMAGDFTAKRDRWMRIAREALQQSGNPLLPEIREPLPLREAVREPGVAGGIGLFFHQERLSKDSLHGALAGLAGDGSAHVSLLIGPEGGLSDDEVEFLKGAGFRPVFLGDTVLRTETAAVYAIAAVKTLLWERDEWTLSV